MGAAAEILALRNEHLSSVTRLLAAIEQVHVARNDKIPARIFLLNETADLVLTNVAAHAGDALQEPPVTRRTPRTKLPVRRKSRRFDAGSVSRQALLFR
jgi:hypothetical protein